MAISPHLHHSSPSPRLALALIETPVIKSIIGWIGLCTQGLLGYKIKDTSNILHALRAEMQLRFSELRLSNCIQFH